MVPRVRSFVLFIAALGVVIALLVAVGAVGAASAEPAQAGEVDSLADLVVDPTPWLHLEANSEQRSPVYLGATPRELQFGLDPVDGGLARLPESVRALGEEQLHVVWQSLVGAGLITTADAVEIEGWPAHDDRARFTWAFARWRLSPDDPWRWLTTDQPQLSRIELYQDVATAICIPVLLDPLVPEDNVGHLRRPGRRHRLALDAGLRRVRLGRACGRSGRRRPAARGARRGLARAVALRRLRRAARPGRLRRPARARSRRASTACR